MLWCNSERNKLKVTLSGSNVSVLVEFPCFFFQFVTFSSACKTNCFKLTDHHTTASLFSKLHPLHFQRGRPLLFLESRTSSPKQARRARRPHLCSFSLCLVNLLQVCLCDSDSSDSRPALPYLRRARVAVSQVAWNAAQRAAFTHTALQQRPAAAGLHQNFGIGGRKTRPPAV